MDKRWRIPRAVVAASLSLEDGGFRVLEEDIYLQAERRVANTLTVTLSVAKRTLATIDGSSPKLCD